MKKKVLFVCTSNMFRSLSAEYALKKYLRDNKIKGWEVGSAGINVESQNISSIVTRALLTHKININHYPRKLNLGLIKNSDIVIAMSKNHLRFIKKRVPSCDVFLFNELAKDKKTSIWDVDGQGNGRPISHKQMVGKVKQTVNYIIKYIPNIYLALNDLFLRRL